MGDLIKIKEKDGKQLVSARELHKFLELDKSQIARWLNSKIIKNPFFTENEITLLLKLEECAERASCPFEITSPL